MCKVASVRSWNDSKYAKWYVLQFIIASNNSIEKVTLTIVLVGTVFVFTFPVAKCRQSEFLTIATVCGYNSSVLARHRERQNSCRPKGNYLLPSHSLCVMLWCTLYSEDILHFTTLCYLYWNYILKWYWMSNEISVKKWEIHFLFWKTLLAYGKFRYINTISFKLAPTEAEQSFFFSYSY